MSRAGYVDKRGNWQARRRRRAWLLATFDPELGPDQAACRLRLHRDCLVVVDSSTLTVDRIEPGGTYARDNIQPACKPCQDRQGYELGSGQWVEPLLQQYRDACHAREALRGSGEIVRSSAVAGSAGAQIAYYQLEERDFDELHPPLLWRDWLIEHAQAAQAALSGAASARAM